MKLEDYMPGALIKCPSFIVEEPNYFVVVQVHGGGLSFITEVRPRPRNAYSRAAGPWQGWVVWHGDGKWLKNVERIA